MLGGINTHNQMKNIYLLLTLATAIFASGCMTERARADAEARRYHCRKCTCEKFTITDPKMLRTALCIHCGHDAEAHSIPSESLK
jgi:hypothetical protein